MARNPYAAKKYRPNRAGSHKSLKYNKVWRCDGCGKCTPKAPPQCLCGSIKFLFFDSTSEAGRWSSLLLLESRGKISNLRRQVRYPLHAAGVNRKERIGHIVPDFEYLDQDGNRVVEDHKGQLMDLSKWKMKHFKAEYGFEILLTQ